MAAVAGGQPAVIRPRMELKVWAEESLVPPSAAESGWITTPPSEDEQKDTNIKHST
ncbi:hypothetical protein WMY93_034388, partial [Mugilogobius chulae]